MKNVARLKMQAEVLRIMLEGGDLPRWINEVSLDIAEAARSRDEFITRLGDVTNLVDEIRTQIEADGDPHTLILIRLSMGGTVGALMAEFPALGSEILSAASTIFNSGHRRRILWAADVNERTSNDNEEFFESLEEFVDHLIPQPFGEVIPHRKDVIIAAKFRTERLANECSAFLDFLFNHEWHRLDEAAALSTIEDYSRRITPEFAKRVLDWALA